MLSFFDSRLSQKGRSVPAFILWVLLLVLLFWPDHCVAEFWGSTRLAMIKEIEDDVIATSRYIGTSTLNTEVMKAMGRIPRHEFVPEHIRHFSYDNRPLPIGHGQTISQPYIVALMTHLLNPKKDHIVLEIGTGSGYQAAVLSALVSQVKTIEIIKPLAAAAISRLAKLKYKNVEVKQADGFYGWAKYAPFDSIIVTAAGEYVPPPLILQLKAGGRMVIPVGSRFDVQHLLLIEKSPEGELTTRQILPVRFVPFTGKH